MGFLQKILMAILRPVLLLLWAVFRMAAFVLILAIAAMIFWRGALSGAVTSTFENALGLPVTVEGDVGFMLDSGFGVAVTDLVVENPEWAVRDDFLKIDSMAVQLNPWAMFSGRSYIRDMRANGVSLALERGAEGAGGVTNYAPVLARLRENRESPPAMQTIIAHMTLQNVTVFIRNADQALELDVPQVSGGYNRPQNPGALVLDSASMTARGSDMTASLLIEPGLEHLRVSGDAAAGMLDMPRLFPRPPAPPSPDGPPVELPVTLGDALAAFFAADVPVIQGVDMNIRLDVDDLRLPGYTTQGVHAILRQQDGVLTVEEVPAK